MGTKKKNISTNYGDAPRTINDRPFYGFTLDDDQINFVNAILNPDNTIVYCDAKAGSGKAQPKDTLIPTPYGEKLLGNIKVGDYVFDRCGKPTKVLGVFDQGEQEAFRVTFNDGRSTICAGEHLWTYYNINKKGQLVTETLNSMLGRSIIAGSNGARYNIPINEAVEYSEKDFAIDPYVIGVFLGDGCCTCRPLTLSSADEDLVASVSDLIGATYKKVSDKNYNWIFKKDGKQIVTSDFFNIYQSMIGDSYHKRVPKEYFYGSVTQRFSLLQGLMDTDGGITYADGRFNMSYTSVNKGMIEDILKIIYSLGYSATINMDYRDKYKNGVAYSLNFKVKNSDKEKLFRLQRKKEIAKEAKKTDQIRKYDRVAIHNIEDLGYKCQMVCIYVDNDEHLYLTNDFIVTHNTTLSIGTADILVKHNEYDGIVYICSAYGDKQGFLPGTLTEKSEVYFEPAYQAMIECNINPHTCVNSDSMVNQKYGDAYVTLITSTYLRGTNLKNKIIIIDEAQNYTVAELKKVLTRCSDDCKIIVIGHHDQCDLDDKSKSGFVKYLNHFNGHEHCQICELTVNHRGWVSQFADELQE